MSAELTVPERLGFLRLAAQMRRRLTRRAPCEVLAIAEELRGRRSASGFVLASQRWRWGEPADPIAELRVVTIRGPKSEIANAFAYPIPGRALPVFAAELVATSAHHMLAFIDLQAPGLNGAALARVQRATAAALADHRGPEPLPAPDWAAASGSGAELFERADSPDAAPRFCAALLGALEAWCQLALAPAPGIAEDAHRDALQVYKAHHAAHSPGQRFLGRVFGEDWTRAFYDSFLYA